MNERYCFFCDGRVHSDPHHCPLTFGVERTYSLVELLKVKEDLRKRRESLFNRKIRLAMSHEEQSQ